MRIQPVSPAEKSRNDFLKERQQRLQQPSRVVRQQGDGEKFLEELRKAGVTLPGRK